MSLKPWLRCSPWLCGRTVCAGRISVCAQTYPTKPIRMVIPFAPGGNTDIIGRIFVPKMAEIIGQQIIVDNRGGAGGMIGTEF